METVASGLAANHTVELRDASGTSLNATAVSYRVLDESDTEILALQTISGFVASSPVVTISTDGALNTLTPPAVRSMRVLLLECTTASGTVYVRHEYLIEALDTLVVGVNSFVTYNQAVLIAYDISSLDGWNAGAKSVRQQALVQAYHNVCRVRLRNIVGYNDQQRVVMPFELSGGLKDMDKVQLSNLDARLQKAIRRAQIIEADFVMADNTVEDWRRAGVMSMTVGESSQFFRTTKALELSICRRALHELAPWIEYSAQIGRS